MGSPSMEFHPVFHKFPETSRSGLDKSGTSKRYRHHPHTYDFGAWGEATSLAQIRANEASGTSQFFRRTVAPHVVERGPLARSVSNFPGYDPSRDRSYFDRPKADTKMEPAMQWPPITGRNVEIWKVPMMEVYRQDWQPQLESSSTIRFKRSTSTPALSVGSGRSRRSGR
eukprot:TRINITY_DN101403_c0_g1_i1.p1 TRINITY_DN101403_c0_g1~~TRINITY_DN101403_c0_g1_i1.p1  ORF type:complete len:170 (-),score=17.01 TRINITY_DN101403_c0_g1_i1:169-678(-)